MENVEENRINFIIATIIQEAENAKDRQKIEQLKEEARRCGLDIEEEIERQWVITRTELEAEQRYWMFFFKPFIFYP